MNYLLLQKLTFLGHGFRVTGFFLESKQGRSFLFSEQKCMKCSESRSCSWCLPLNSLMLSLWPRA